MFDDVSVRLYQPEGAHSTRGLVYIHGGGFIAGSPSNIAYCGLQVHI